MELIDRDYLKVFYMKKEKLNRYRISINATIDSSVLWKTERLPNSTLIDTWMCQNSPLEIYYGRLKNPKYSYVTMTRFIYAKTEKEAIDMAKVDLFGSGLSKIHIRAIKIITNKKMAA